MTAEIPDKLYFKIGEVAELTGVKTHVLRYWETEFEFFRPAKSKTNQRLYRRRDIELAFLIKDLLYRQRITIAGVRKILSLRSTKGEGDTLSPLILAKSRQLLNEIRSDLNRLRNSLNSSTDPH